MRVGFVAGDVAAILPSTDPNVGAGLPAMQAPRCVSQTSVRLSQASQLLHFFAVFQSSLIGSV
ncbi:hypothetical protein FIV38_19375 [Pseudomonas proteolytica]|nr:hypothetical protein F4W61_16245 [Pseudomonas proteolytica]QHG26541.1 hypothetical protein GDV60_24545 [Pseudomonas sp. DTU12.1]TWR79082.1 hypothetical protein FIV38_19375 [Pseudomonas proteolytica]